MALFSTQRNLPPVDYLKRVIDSMARDTPFMAAVKRGQVPVDWKQTVEVRRFPVAGKVASAEGKKFDGAQDPFKNLELGVQMEYFRSVNGYGVTPQAQAMPGVNGSGKLALQQAEDAQDLLQSIENELCSAQEAVERGTGTTEVAQTRGALSWLQRAADGTHTVQAIPTKLIPTAGYKGDVTALTEALFKAEILKAAKQRNGKISLVGFVGMDLHEQMADWLGRVKAVTGVEQLLHVNRNATDKKLSEIVNEFEYTGGTIRVMDSNHVGADTTTNLAPDGENYNGIFIDLRMWEFQTLLSLKAHDLPDLGQGPNGFHEMTARLACFNPMAQFAVIHKAA